MQCPDCRTELPDDAKFCGACGRRFAPPPSAAEDAPLPPRASTPVSTPVSAPVSTPAATPVSTPAASPVAKLTPSSPLPASSFDLVPADFARALAKACDKAGLLVPQGPPPHDHASLFKAAAEAGLTKLDVEKALHHVSIEKLPADARKAMGVVLEDDMPQQGKPLWLPLVIGINLVALVVGFGAFLFYDPKPQAAPVEPRPEPGEIEDMAALSAALDAFAKRAEDCYKEALVKNDKLAGDVTLTLRIDLEGKVAAASLAKDELRDEGAIACILEAAKAGTYPKALKAPVDVDVPLLFSARAH